MLVKVLTYLLLFCSIAIAQTVSVIEETDKSVTVEVDFTGVFQIKDSIAEGINYKRIVGGAYYTEQEGLPSVPYTLVTLGVPAGAKPKVENLSIAEEQISNTLLLKQPIVNAKFASESQRVFSSSERFPKEKVLSGAVIRFRDLNYLNVTVYPYQWNPLTRTLSFTPKIRFRINFNNSILSGVTTSDPMTKEFIESRVVNKSALSFASPKQRSERVLFDSAGVPYNIDSYNLYVKTEDVYRITYAELKQKGAINTDSIASTSLRVFQGTTEIPLEISDGGDGFFHNGDHFRFVGFAAPATPYSNLNIYNNTNVYRFFVTPTDTGLRYVDTEGWLPTFQRTLNTVLETKVYEKDSLYERFGHAGDDKRDFWQWGKVIGEKGLPKQNFYGFFDPFPEWNETIPYATVTLSMHGMTDFISEYNHNVFVKINDFQLANVRWAGQSSYLFKQRFKIAADSVPMYPAGNFLSVIADGNIPDQSKYDELRVNYFQLEYWRYNRTNPNNYFFQSPPDSIGINQYHVWRWARDNMKILVPQRNKSIINPYFAQDVFSSVFFSDTLSERTKYYAVASDYYKTVDSIAYNLPSSLRSTANGADYIIIAHRNFTQTANRLKSLREKNFPDTAFVNPRIYIAYIDDVYDEFSKGLLDPWAVRDFLQYTTTHWQGTTPSYVAIIGDMSFDYRKVLSSSRASFVPAAPLYSDIYGISASDNNLVVFNAPYSVPEMSIGRISIETVDEGNIFLDKLEQYPADAGKEWQRTTLLLASGVDEFDELVNRFNERSEDLETRFVGPVGLKADYVFRYPMEPDHLQYKGTGVEIRQKIDNGAVVVNYYGHGGGYQWDLTFLNDDIYALNNANRQPLVLSFTCLTAHYDNQNVFGEQFIKVPNKGAIGFIGSSALTYWNPGRALNESFFNQIYIKRQYVSGKALTYAKAAFSTDGVNALQTALTVYLGDPVLKLAFPEKPDFKVENTSIKFSEPNPLVGQNLNIRVNVKNMGILTKDSVKVTLGFTSTDTTGTVGSKTFPVFSLQKDFEFLFVPRYGGSYNFTVSVEGLAGVNEIDVTDNVAQSAITIYNLSEPLVMQPLNGQVINGTQPEFAIADAGYYANKSLTYYIEVDTGVTFSSPILLSQALTSQSGVVKWSPTLQSGRYYWRTRVFDGSNYGRWLPTSTFSVSSAITNNELQFTASQLLLGENKGMVFNKSLGGYTLNLTESLPKPDTGSVIKTIPISAASPLDTLGMTLITEDGTYFYIADRYYTALNYHPTGKTKIYKVGTGLNGTTEGGYYGTVGSFEDNIRVKMFYYGGSIYYPSGDMLSMSKVNLNDGSVSNVNLTDSLYDYASGTAVNGFFRVSVDSVFMYNLALIQVDSKYGYVVRKFDISKNFQFVKQYNLPNIEAYATMPDFFVVDEVLYLYDDFNSGYMKSVDLEQGILREEWLTAAVPGDYIQFWAWHYSKSANRVYATRYRPEKPNAKREIRVFEGKKQSASAEYLTPAFGPAYGWDSVAVSIDKNSSNSTVQTTLYGLNSTTKQWQSLTSDFGMGMPLSTVDPVKYPSVKVGFKTALSTLGTGEYITIKGARVKYKPLPELAFDRESFVVLNDSSLQGTPLNFSAALKNYGKSNVDSTTVSFTLNRDSSPFYTTKVPVKGDSLTAVEVTVATDKLLHQQTISASAFPVNNETVLFNNQLTVPFFVSRDSLKPNLSVTFDGEEILPGDIVSSTPSIRISLKDNSPLPLDTTAFRVILNNKVQYLNQGNVAYSYSPYPNSEGLITFTPTLKEGRQTLDILTKDASNNYHDSVFTRYTFYVYSSNEIARVYNYPNPFSSAGTNFTFELRGFKVPESITLHIYTVTGRKIREIQLNSARYSIGFNSIPWDGRDEDGDTIANGVYLYKLIAKYSDKTTELIEKIAKVE